MKINRVKLICIGMLIYLLAAILFCCCFAQSAVADDAFHKLDDDFTIHSFMQSQAFDNCEDYDCANETYNIKFVSYSSEEMGGLSSICGAGQSYSIDVNYNDSIEYDFNVGNSRLIKLTINGYDIDTNCSRFLEDSIRRFEYIYDNENHKLKFTYNIIKDILLYAYENSGYDALDYNPLVEEQIKNGIEIKYAFVSQNPLSNNKYFFAGKSTPDAENVSCNGSAFIEKSEDTDLMIYTDKNQQLGNIKINGIDFHKKEANELFAKVSNYTNAIHYEFNYASIVDLLAKKQLSSRDGYYTSYLYSKYLVEKQINENYLIFEYSVIDPSFCDNKREELFKEYYESNLSFKDNNKCHDLLNYIFYCDNEDGLKLKNIFEEFDNLSNSGIRNFNLTNDYLLSQNCTSDNLCFVVFGSKLNNDGMLKKENIETLDLSVKYHNQFNGSYILLTGCNTTSNNNKTTENQLMKNYLVEHGIEEKYIIEDTSGKDIVQNAKNSFELLNNSKYMNVNKMFLLTRDYQMDRTYLTFLSWMIYNHSNSNKEINIAGCLTSKTEKLPESKFAIAQSVYQSITGKFPKDWNDFDFTVMSYNLRCLDDKDVVYDDGSVISNKIASRIPRVEQNIMEYLPDSIGVQEAKMESWIKPLQDDLESTYSYIGKSRDKDDNGESSGIFYNKNRLKVLESGVRWFSDKPEKVGSRYNNDIHHFYDEENTKKLKKHENSQDIYPRHFTYAVFQRIHDGKIYMHINSHCDLGTGANLQNAIDEIDFTRDYSSKIPVILTADYNAYHGAPKEPFYQNDNLIYELQGVNYLIDKCKCLNAAYEAEITNNINTFPTKYYFDCDGQNSEGWIIDYILGVHDDVDFDQYKVITEMVKAKSDSREAETSDHYPIFARGHFKSPSTAYTGTYNN